jgi:hypothetical protein
MLSELSFSGAIWVEVRVDASGTVEIRLEVNAVDEVLQLPHHIFGFADDEHFGLGPLLSFDSGLC